MHVCTSWQHKNKQIQRGQRPTSIMLPSTYVCVYENGSKLCTGLLLEAGPCIPSPKESHIRLCIGGFGAVNGLYYSASSSHYFWSTYTFPPIFTPPSEACVGDAGPRSEDLIQLGFFSSFFFHDWCVLLRNR